MFEQHMERLEREIDNALLFYCISKDLQEQERRLVEAAEASLERLQICRNALGDAGQANGLSRRIRDYLTISDSILEEGVVKFTRSELHQEGNKWDALTVRTLSLCDELTERLSLEPSMVMGTH